MGCSRGMVFPCQGVWHAGAERKGEGMPEFCTAFIGESRDTRNWGRNWVVYLTGTKALLYNNFC